MPVTTANTIRFSNVCLEIYGSSSTAGRTLLTAHNDTVFAGYNQSFDTFSDTLTLLDFRGYDHFVVPPGLDTPTNLIQFESGFNYIIAQWDNMPNAVSYNVFVGGVFFQNVFADTLTIETSECVDVSVSSVSGSNQSAVSNVVTMCPSNLFEPAPDPGGGKGGKGI